MQYGSWDDYNKLAKWLFSKKNEIFTDDDNQNCYIIYRNCKAKHNAEKSSFKTYLTHSINNYIKTKKSTEYKKNRTESGSIDDVYYTLREREYEFIVKLALNHLRGKNNYKFMKVYYRRCILKQPISYINKLYGLSSRTTYLKLISSKACLKRILRTNEVACLNKR